MNKKIVLFYIILITLTLLVFILCSSKTYNYENILLDSTQWDEILSSRENSSTELLDKVKFNDYEIFYENSTSTYYYSLIENDNNKYNPKITVEGKAVKIALNKSINADTISQNETIQLLAYNEKEYKIYNLKCTTLPLLNIDTGSMPADKIYKAEETDIDLTLFDNSNGSVKRVVKSQGSMHARGNSTVFFPKRGYKISLTTESIGNNKRNNDISLLGMRMDDDWILYPAYNDQEKIRNVFAMNLWEKSCATNNQFNINNGTEYKYIELFFNNEYWGLFALGFPIDEKQLNIEDNDYMFKKRLWVGSESNVFSQQTLEMEGYDLISKNSNTEEAWNSLKEYYMTLQTTISTEELYELSDINSTIDYYLFQNFMQGTDNSVGFYVYNVILSLKKSGNKNVMLYTPWDYDACLGNMLKFEDTVKNNTVPYSFSPESNIEFRINPAYYLQQQGDTKIVEMIKNRYEELRKSYWSEEAIEEMLVEYEDDIYNSGAFSRDKARWPEGSYNDEEEKLTRFKAYVQERIKYMDEYVESL